MESLDSLTPPAFVQESTASAKRKPVAPHETAYENFRRYAHSIPLLEPKEEAAVIAKVVAGDDAAKKQLVEANYRLVLYLATRYCGMGLPLMDVIQEGAMGLMRAVELYKPGKSKFSSYAGLRIRSHIMRALSNQSRIIRMSVHHYSALYSIRKAELLLLIRLERDPTLQEVAKHTKMSPAKILEMQERNYANQSMVWLDKPITNLDETHMLHETIVDDKATDPTSTSERSSLGLLLDSVLGELKPKDRQILRMRFGLDGQEPQTMELVGRALKITKQGVQLSQKRSLKKLQIKLGKHKYVDVTHAFAL